MDRRGHSGVIIAIIVAAVLVFGAIFALDTLGDHLLKHILPFHIIRYLRKFF